MLVTIPSKTTIFDVNIPIHPNDMKRLKKLDDIEKDLNDFDGSEWLVLKEYRIRDYYIRLKVDYNSSYLWIGLELLDNDGTFIIDAPLETDRILNGQKVITSLLDDENPKEKIRFDISYVLDETVESCLDSNQEFIEIEKELKEYSYTCPHCKKDLRDVNVIRRGEFYYTFYERDEKFEYDYNSLADTPFLCGNCYNVLEKFDID